MSKVVLMLWLTACGNIVRVPEDGFDFDDLTKLAEAYCAANPQIPCGHVWMCEATAENELGLAEVCVLDETPIEGVEAVYGACVPTPRHQGLCLHCCPTETTTCGTGCNALNGCWCGDPRVIN